MKSGKLTIKHQVTIPRDVRQALGLKAGDELSFALEDGRAVLMKVDRAEIEWSRFLQAQMPERDDPQEDAYWAAL